MSEQLDIQAETPIALTDAADLLPRRHGKKIHHSTIYRWATKGARGRVLTSWLVGGVRYTSIESLNRFLQPEADHSEDDRRAALKQALYGNAK